MIESVLLFLVKFIHTCITIVVTFGALLFSNTKILLFIITLNIFVVTGWYLYGYCFLTDIEKALGGANYENNESFITDLLQQYLSFIPKNVITISLSWIPFISTVICCYRILYKQ
jgi:hypothetical protein